MLRVGLHLCLLILDDQLLNFILKYLPVETTFLLWPLFGLYNDGSEFEVSL